MIAEIMFLFILCAVVAFIIVLIDDRINMKRRW